MFRLASLLGVACLALAACVLAGHSTQPSENESLEDHTNTNRNLRPEGMVRIHGGLYYAQFSVN
jgi:hypothetical protein